MLAPYCLAADKPSAAAIGSKLLRHCQYCPDVISTFIPQPQRMHCRAACRFWARNPDQGSLKDNTLPAYCMHWTSWLNSLLVLLQEHVLCMFSMCHSEHLSITEPLVDLCHTDAA